MFMLKYNEAIQDKYRLGQKIGEGSFGIAVLAKNKETSQVRVVKTI
jgi:serine/threonine protein kinase